MRRNRGRSDRRCGDRVVTRKNNRRLVAGATWVKNGDAWTVRAVCPDGALTVQRENGCRRRHAAGEYARIHVELGYAATVFRAQGRTVDTAHSLVGATASRESLYVAATRGRQANTLYVDLETDPDDETSHGDTEHGSAGQILRAVLDRSSADTAAHTALERRRPDTGATS
jgi:ATP-dependent exoDNAse (exonuclease V) alpha subunit